jgi:hypothetical protein
MPRVLAGIVPVPGLFFFSFAVLPIQQGRPCSCMMHADEFLALYELLPADLDKLFRKRFCFVQSFWVCSNCLAFWSAMLT